MKIFGIYLKINLLEKPKWFNQFINEYFEPVDLHITLIQPRYVDEKDITKIEDIIREIISNLDFSDNEKNIHSSELLIGREDNGKHTLMLKIEDNKMIGDLQRKLCERLNQFNNYIDKITIEYELNYIPHITVSRELVENEKDAALKYFLNGCEIGGVVDSVVLSVVDDTSTEQRSDNKNKIIFSLR